MADVCVCQQSGGCQPSAVAKKTKAGRNTLWTNLYYNRPTMATQAVVAATASAAADVVDAADVAVIADPPVSASTSAPAPVVTVSNKKRRLSPTQDNPIISAAFLHAACQAAAVGFPATHAALVTGIIPSVAQVQTSAKKMVQESPPIVHFPKTDTAPQLKVDNYLTVKGGMRGYRMARASHGVLAAAPSTTTNNGGGGGSATTTLNSGDYYFECWIQQGPTVDEIKSLFPPNVRLAPKLKQQLMQTTSKSGESSTTNPQTPSTAVGGHTRIGWSTRLGDLQAPVGYDKWSYGYRDIQGSRVHNSKREDDWGSEPYEPGDIVGFAIAAEEKQIYFFKNGEAMGHFVLSRGKREGGAAFEDIAEGTYYPAVSVYLGGTVRANFGPHFVYNPRKLPHGVKVKPMSDLCEKPPTVEEISNRISKLPKKTDDALVKALEEAMKAEAEIRNESYQQHYQQHVQDVKKEREARNLSTNDLEF